MRLAKILIAFIIVALVVIQFLPSGIPANKPDDEKSITRTNLATEPALTLLRRSCFDCHSNNVRLPWYSRVAPASWVLAGHIKEGKSHLNFSEWQDYSRIKKIGLLEDISEEAESGGMPLKSYLLIHRDAGLSANDISALSKWTEESSALVME